MWNLEVYIGGARWVSRVKRVTYALFKGLECLQRNVRDEKTVIEIPVVLMTYQFLSKCSTPHREYYYF